MAESTAEVHDVVIIGAGLAGLVCADTLLAERPDAKVLVLEALDRCGGRTKSSKLRTRDVVVDEGGMWLGKLHTVMLGLCSRFGVQLVEQHEKGKDVLMLSDGSRHLSSLDHQDYPQLGLLRRLDLLVNVMWELERLIKLVPEKEPWNHKRAQEWDGNSMYSYFQKRVWFQSSLDVVNNFVKALAGCEASQVSLLYAIWSLKVSGGLQFSMDVKNGAQEWRLLGGVQQISQGLVDSIQSHPNARVLYSHHVSHVDNVQGLLHVRVRDQDSVFICKELISAGNITVITREVKFTPRLPALIEQIGQRAFRGSYGKALVVFREPFWRTSGLSGLILNSKPSAFTCSVLDYSLPDEHNFYALACFFSGNSGMAIASLTEEERKEGVLSELAEGFTIPREHIDAQFLEYKEHLWHMDPVIQGCSSSIYGPGHFCTLAAARVFNGTPCSYSNIHFIGTDVSDVFVGYMEGAARTGKAMGAHLAHKLGSSSTL